MTCTSARRYLCQYLPRQEIFLRLVLLTYLVSGDELGASNTIVIAIILMTWPLDRLSLTRPINCFVYIGGLDLRRRIFLWMLSQLLSARKVWSKAMQEVSKTPNMGLCLRRSWLGIPNSDLLGKVHHQRVYQMQRYGAISGIFTSSQRSGPKVSGPYNETTSKNIWFSNLK